MHTVPVIKSIKRDRAMQKLVSWSYKLPYNHTRHLYEEPSQCIHGNTISDAHKQNKFWPCKRSPDRSVDLPGIITCCIHQQHSHYTHIAAIAHTHTHSCSNLQHLKFECVEGIAFVPKNLCPVCFRRPVFLYLYGDTLLFLYYMHRTRFYRPRPCLVGTGQYFSTVEKNIMVFAKLWHTYSYYYQNIFRTFHRGKKPVSKSRGIIWSYFKSHGFIIDEIQVSHVCLHPDVSYCWISL